MPIVIYQIICLKNDKRYIGRTKNFEKRIKYHKGGLKANQHYNGYLQNDYNLYGENYFSFEIIEIVEEKDANFKEDYWIDYYGGIESQFVYNYQTNKTKNKEHSNKISDSKKGSLPWNKGRKMTEMEIEVNRQSHIGIKRTKASIEKQKLSIKNNPNFGNKGKHLSEETKQKISEAKKGRIPYNKGKTRYTHELIDDFKNDLANGKSYEYIIAKHSPEFKLGRYMIKRLIECNGPPWLKK